jgi:hypothetical protein
MIAKGFVPHTLPFNLLGFLCLVGLVLAGVSV